MGVGAIVAWKVRSNPIGWLLLVFGSMGTLVGFVVLLVADSGNQSLLAWVDATHSAVTTATILLFPIVLLRFPDGAITTSGQRGVEWLCLATAIVGGTAALLNGGWGGQQSQALAISPLYEATRPVGDVLSRAFFLLFAASFVLAGVSLILRYRTSDGERRQQFKFLAYSAGFTIASLGLLLVMSNFALAAADELWQELLLSLGFASIPLAIGLAVLRYRLYDIDIVISRTVVLGVLAGFITLTYALVVVGLGQLVGEASDGLLLPIAATAVIAVAFEPVRNIAQAWANRLVYGKRATPYEVLSDLTRRLGRAEEGEGILNRLATLLCDGTGAERATVWLGVPGAMEPAATSPADADVELMPDLDAPSTFTVFHEGEVIGALEVVKPRGTVLSTAERSLVTDLAGSAGAVLGYQRLNNSLAERARELEESRARLMGVQDQERRRLERDLHEGAEQFIVALKVKIGVVSQLAGKHEAPDLEVLLHGLTGEAQAALDDVQSLAKGIYPPILESDGLGAAISALASSSPVEVRFERDGLGRYPMEIEAAVYFDVSEAVTNAVKHAEPPIRVVLSHHDGMLTFSVVDAGPGFEIDESKMGSGLENMADRLDAIGGILTVNSARGESTEVSGTIPVESLALI